MEAWWGRRLLGCEAGSETFVSDQQHWMEGSGSIQINYVRIRNTASIWGNHYYLNQCCGSGSESGSTCFLGLPDPDPDPLVRGMDPDPDNALDPDRILLSSCKKNKKNLDSCYFVTLFDFLSLKNDINELQKVISRKNCIKKLVFCWNLEGQWRK